MLGVVKWNVGGHGCREAFGECCDLMVNVGEESVRAPAAQDLDGFGIIAIEMKGCGSSSPKGVTGDERGWDALAFQVKGCGCFP